MKKWLLLGLVLVLISSAHAGTICDDDIDNDGDGFIDEGCGGINQDTNLIIEECIQGYNETDLDNLLAFDTIYCPALDELRASSCTGYPVLNVIDSDFGIRFHSPDATGLNCQVAVTELGAIGVDGVSLNGVSLTEVSSDVMNRGACNEQTTYYNGVVDLVSGDDSSIATVDVVAGNNFLVVDAHSSKLKNIDIVCDPTPVTMDYSISFDRTFYETNSPVRISVDITKQPQRDLSYFGDVQFTMLFESTPANIVNLPNFCSGAPLGGDFLVSCEPTQEQFNLQLSFPTENTFTYSSRLDYHDFTAVQSVIKAGDFDINGTITAGVSGRNDTLLLTTTNNEVKNFSSLVYGDVIKAMALECANPVPSAEVVIRNVNTQTSCPFFSNDRRGDGRVYFDLGARDRINPTGQNCSYPFEIERSGLYELEFTCFTGNLCEGQCYNPIPETLPTTFAAWNVFWDLGRYLFSFFNDNSIPDCVCNREADLVPIETFSQTIPITVSDEFNNLPLELEFVNPPEEIMKGDTQAVQVRVTCNDPSGCTNVEVFLDP